MQRIFSDDAEIFYDVAGAGSPVLLLHPFPLNHEFWIPVSRFLSSRYRLIMPDLRGHGESGLGDGPATMQKHVFDLVSILNDADVERVPVVGVSIGGYIIFEFWRHFRDRISALVLCNTKAQADSPEARNARLESANDVLQRGTGSFFEGMAKKCLGETTKYLRPDLVEGALRMMRKMSAEDVAGVQRGMAARPDSMSTLKTINISTLIITGDEDKMTGVPEAELMKQNVQNSQLKVVSKAGHYSPWEQPEEVGRILRQFFDSGYGK
ncbi:MAG TPA: alpha/beta fold hydrolase [Terriglobales bacterium]|nr:alpha/beta fold hydrolase [Terriglobales bacterium]